MTVKQLCDRLTAHCDPEALVLTDSSVGYWRLFEDSVVACDVQADPNTPNLYIPYNADDEETKDQPSVSAVILGEDSFG